MLKAEISTGSRTRTGLAGIAVAGFALPVIVGLSITAIGHAAADVTNKQSFTAAQAGSASSNVVSFRGATTPPARRARIRPAVVGSAAPRSGAAPKTGAVAAFTAAQAQTASPALRAAEPPKIGAALVPAEKGTIAEASRPAEQLKASMAERPATVGNDAVMRPVAIATAKNNAAVAPAQASTLTPTRATAAVAPTTARAPTNAVAMLAPASTAAADRSAIKELLKSKATAIALRKARHAKASHAR